jgi:hypothetical protein
LPKAPPTPLLPQRAQNQFLHQLASSQEVRASFFLLHSSRDGFGPPSPAVPQSAIRIPHSRQGGFGRLCPAVFSFQVSSRKEVCFPRISSIPRSIPPADCSPTEKTLQERDTPQNKRNTRNPNRKDVSSSPARTGLQPADFGLWTLQTLRARGRPHRARIRQRTYVPEYLGQAFASH